MIPLKDEIRSPRPPIATVSLIVIMIGLALSGWQPDLDGLTWPIAALLAAVLTAGIFQLAANALFLWLFGKSVEGSTGPGGLVGIFALGALVSAAAAELLGDATVVATGGAGAVAAVIAAHCVLHPRARILCFVLIPFFFTFVLLPAVLLAAVWLGLQAIPAVGDTAGAAFPGDPGVSLALLVGGLAAGAAAAALIRSRGLARVETGQPAF